MAQDEQDIVFVNIKAQERYIVSTENDSEPRFIPNENKLLK